MKIDVITDRAVIVSKAFGILIYAHRSCLKQNQSSELKSKFESELTIEPSQGEFRSFKLKPEKGIPQEMAETIEICRKEAIQVANASLNKDISSGRFMKEALVKDSYSATGTIYPEVSGKFRNHTGTFNGTINK